MPYRDLNALFGEDGGGGGGDTNGATNPPPASSSPTTTVITNPNNDYGLGRALHSSTFQLNLNTFCGMSPWGSCTKPPK